MGRRSAAWRCRQLALALCGLGLIALQTGCITLSTRKVDIHDFQVDPLGHERALAAHVEAIAKPVTDQGITPGLIVGVYTPATGMHFYGYGTYDQSVGAPPDADTVFPVGSLTKLFVGALLSQFVQEGKLSWQDRLMDVLSGDIALSPDAAYITLEELATHTSGLPRQPMTIPTFAYFIRYLLTGESFYHHFDRPYLFRFLADFRAPVIRGYRYSNIAYALLGHILEQRSGVPLETLLEQRLLGPLGMQHTALSDAALPAHLKRARGYAGDQPGFIRRGDPVPDWQFTPMMRATGAMHSTARDMLTFARAHLNERDTELGRALADTLTVRAHTSDTGVGVDWERDDIHGQRIHFTIGFVAGYSSYIGLDTRDNHAVVVLQNSFNWDDRVGHRLLVRLHNRQDERR